MVISAMLEKRVLFYLVWQAGRGSWTLWHGTTHPQLLHSHKKLLNMNNFGPKWIYEDLY